MRDPTEACLDLPGLRATLTFGSTSATSLLAATVAAASSVNPSTTARPAPACANLTLPPSAWMLAVKSSGMLLPLNRTM